MEEPQPAAQPEPVAQAQDPIASDSTVAAADVDAGEHAEPTTGMVAEGTTYEADGEAKAPEADRAAIAPVATEPDAADISAPAEKAAAELPAVAAPTPAASAEVIPLDALSRKHKSGFTASSATPAATRARRSGRLATKIAASILILVAAATFLATLDRAALGSVPPPPWLPLPGYAPATITLPFFTRKAEALGKPGAEAGMEVRPAAVWTPEDPLLRRYLEIWPSGS
jgi:hypothetical protein